MALEAATKALLDAGITYDSIEHAYVGYVYGDSTCGQSALYGLGLTGSSPSLPLPSAQTAHAHTRSLPLSPSHAHNLHTKPLPLTPTSPLPLPRSPRAAASPSPPPLPPPAVAQAQLAMLFGARAGSGAAAARGESVHAFPAPPLAAQGKTRPRRGTLRISTAVGGGGAAKEGTGGTWMRKIRAGWAPAH